MKAVLLVLALLRHSLANPTIEDNKIPTDQEILGQPEEVASLGLPSDEESFNRLSVFFTPSKPSGNLGVGSGTYHFVSSTFPEVDARGFHESVFDGIGDYFPSWPAPYKRADQYSIGPSLAQRLGLQPRTNLRKRSEPLMDHLTLRKKRFIQLTNSSEDAEDDGSLQGNFILGVYSTQIPLDNSSGRTKHLSKRELYNEESNPDKRSGGRYVRGMEMGSSGFHGDIFSRDFGDFVTMRKRARGAMGFHGDTFSDGFGDFATMKRSLRKKKLLTKLKEYMSKITGTNEMHSDSQNVEHSSETEPLDDEPLNEITKRRPEMTSMGFHGDTFSRGFGEFEPYKKRLAMASKGFHGDTFSQSFGDFATYKKRRPEMDSMGFHGDTFSRGFGDFDPFKKRRPEMDSMGFHGDTFTRGFGEFDPYKKRLAMASSGFHGDTFSQGFGDFSTYKKRRPEMNSMGFHGDTFSRGFGEFDTYKKRRPEMDSMGFHGDTFSRGFGDFDTFKKRRPEMESMGFHGDTFNRGFGEFDMYKKSSSQSSREDADELKTEGKQCCSDSSIQRHAGVH